MVGFRGAEEVRAIISGVKTKRGHHTLRAATKGPPSHEFDIEDGATSCCTTKKEKTLHRFIFIKIFVFY